MRNHIILVSNTCSNNEFLSVQKIKTREKLNPSQKFFDMMINGFCENEDCIIHCVTARAIAHSNCRIKYLPRKEEQVNEKLDYTYMSIINLPIIRNVFNILHSYSIVKKIARRISKNDTIALICDPLAYDITFGAQLAVKKKSIQKMSVVTDLPYYMTKINKSVSKSKIKTILSKIREKWISSILRNFDSYCFLTASMNKINKSGKPFIIIEGFVPDSNKKITNNEVSNNIVVYAGGLLNQFGIDTLVSASTKIAIPGFELHLYGEGSSVDYINSISMKFSYIKYMGVASLEEIVEVEKNAKLLINPRPSTEEFTEYSFPSKTLEYLSAARPVLSTRLKGIPEEYFNYLIPIDIETEEGIKDVIEKMLSLDASVLNKIGMDGYKFVYENKCNFIQSKKIIDFLFR